MAEYIIPGLPGSRTDLVGQALGVGGGDAPPPPPAPPSSSALPRVPDIMQAKRRVDAAPERVKRGRRSTILTGDEGVGASPLGYKTLVGS